MNLSNKKYLFTNGTSITHGGGFEEYKYRQDVRDAYKIKGIELPESQLECSFTYHLSQKLGLSLIDKSKSGSGIDRLVRTTVDWIFKNEHKLDKTIFFLEIQDGIRLDWYVREWEDFGICNAALDEQGKYPFTLVYEWFVDNKLEQDKWNEKHYRKITDWFNNFFDIDVHLNNEIIKTVLLISFLKIKNIDFIVSYHKRMSSPDIRKIENLLESKNTLKDVLDGETNIWEYCKKNKLLINDEVDNDDFHIGLDGNIILSEKIYNKIKNDKNR
jgi:hypothetical protein